MRTRPIATSEIPVVWPAIRNLGLAADAHSFAGALARDPWSVRISASGDIVVLGRWRAGSDSFVIRRIIAPTPRIPDLVADARSVVGSLGARTLLSPLVDASAAAWYRSAGMRDFEAISVFNGRTGAVLAAALTGGRTDAAAEVDTASRSDVAAIVAVDHACFDGFWQQGETEIVEAMARGRLAVVRDGSRRVAAYASALVVGSTVTLARLAVHPALRRRGIASALVADAAHWGQDCGAERFSVCTQRDNRAAKALYASCGLAEVARDLRLLILDV